MRHAHVLVEKDKGGTALRLYRGVDGDEHAQKQTPARRTIHAAWLG